MRKAAWIPVSIALGSALAAQAEYRWTYFLDGSELVSEWALETRDDAGDERLIPIPEPSGLLVFALGLVTIRRAARCARSC